MRMPRSPIPEPGKLSDVFDDCRIPRLLKRDDISVRRLDHLGDLCGAPDSALADVVGEEAHSTLQVSGLSSSSTLGFFRSTR